MAGLKAVLYGQYNWGGETRNVFYFNGDDAVIANGQDITDAIIDCLMQDRTVFSTTYSFYGCNLYNLEAPGVPGAFVTYSSGSLAGTSSSDPLPPQVAALLNLWAASVRPNRKRLYLAGTTEGQTSNGLWGSGQLTKLENIIDDLLDFSTFSSLAIESCAAWYNEAVTTWYLNELDYGRAEEVPATQRRRRRGTGI